MNACVAPPNSLVIVGDLDPRGEVPADYAGEPIAVADDCIFVGTLAEPGGDTLIRFSEGPPSGEFTLAFDGLVDTPSKVLAVHSVVGDLYLSQPIGASKCRLRIYGNHPNEPDEIVIVASDTGCGDTYITST